MQQESHSPHSVIAALSTVEPGITEYWCKMAIDTEQGTDSVLEPRERARPGHCNFNVNHRVACCVHATAKASPYGFHTTIIARVEIKGIFI